MSIKKKKHGFAVFMFVYSFILVAVIAAGLALLWKYMEAYEASNPSAAIKSYETNNLHADYQNNLNALSESLATPFQTAAEIRSYLETCMDESSLNLKKDHASNPDDAPIYSIRLGKEIIGAVRMQYTPLHFGLKECKIADVDWYLEDRFSSNCTVLAPEQAPVTVNGILLNSTNCTTEQAEHSVGTLTQGFDPVYDIRYTFKFYGTPDVAVQQGGKSAYVIDKEEDGSYSVMALCDDATVENVKPFAETFVRDYILFTSNAASYAIARQHMIPGTALYNRISGSVDGMRWVAGITSKLSDLTVDNFVPYGEGIICDAHYKLSDTAGVVRDMNMRILIVQYQGSWKVHNIQMF